MCGVRQLTSENIVRVQLRPGIINEIVVEAPTTMTVTSLREREIENVSGFLPVASLWTNLAVTPTEQPCFSNLTAVRINDAIVLVRGSPVSECELFTHGGVSLEDVESVKLHCMCSVPAVCEMTFQTEQPDDRSSRRERTVRAAS